MRGTIVRVGIAVLMILACCLGTVCAAPLESAVPISLETPSLLLMDAATGTVIFERNADEKRPVASVTKLMTILLTLESLDAGTIRLTDTVIASKAAAGMGGSQALLDANAPYTLEVLLKSTIVASANDSAVALAEHMNGSEEVFVQRMNERARQLSMTNTVYVNCTGLPAAGQYTTARDVAAVAREVGKHPTFFKYSTIWTDTLVHSSGRRTDLVNTNRLVRFYEGCDGFKTGSTNEARYCIAATAARGDLRMIAVVLGTSASQTRFDEARKMLEYGFANYQLTRVANAGDMLGFDVPVRRGSHDTVAAAVGETYATLLRKGQQTDLRLEAALPEALTAPVAKGEIIGEVKVYLGDQVIATLPAVAASDVRLPGYLEGLLRIMDQWR